MSTPPSKPSREHEHLFLLWPNGVSHEHAVSDRLSENFTILDRIRLHWPKQDWEHNLARFYGKSPTELRRKLSDTGIGPVLAFLVRSKEPIWDVRLTSRGFRHVYADAFDAKTVLRELVGGEARVHCTVSPEEYRRDSALLFGPGFTPIETPSASGGVREWRDPLPGSNGWPTLQAMFGMLEAAARYVVLRDGERIAKEGVNSVTGDIDLLVEDRGDAAYLLNARAAGPEAPARFLVDISGREVKLDIHGFGDGFFDSRWARAMLDHRVNVDGISIPDPVNEFYGLLYHCLLHKTFFKLSHVTRLVTLSRRMRGEIKWEQIIDRSVAAGTLARFMAREHYTITQPNVPNFEINDAWATVNPPAKEIANSLIGSLAKAPPFHAKNNDHFNRVLWRTRWFDGSDVAVKHVRADDPDTARILFREGEFLKTLGGSVSPGFVFEAKGANQLLLVSDWLDGPSLEELLDKDHAEIDWSSIREQLCGILGTLRGHGIVHNDIRATNLIFAADGLRLLDFGWSSWRGETLDDNVPRRDDEQAIDELITRIDRRLGSIGS